MACRLSRCAAANSPGNENGYQRLLRDLQAPVVIADVASWVLIPAAPLPSGADRTAAEAFLPADGRLSLAGR
jgi:hypothetical protein